MAASKDTEESGERESPEVEELDGEIDEEEEEEAKEVER